MLDQSIVSSEREETRLAMPRARAGRRGSCPARLSPKQFLSRFDRRHSCPPTFLASAFITWSHSPASSSGGLFAHQYRDIEQAEHQFVGGSEHCEGSAHGQNAPIKPECLAHPLYHLHNPDPQLTFYAHLSACHSQLRLQSVTMGSTYHNFGRLYYSWPLSFIHDARIPKMARFMVRKQFHVHTEFENVIDIPPPIHTLRALEYTLSVAAAALHAGDPEQAQAQLVHVEWLLWQLQQALVFLKNAMDTYCRLKWIREVEGMGMGREKRYPYQRRLQGREMWESMLPRMCWEMQ